MPPRLHESKSKEILHFSTKNLTALGHLFNWLCVEDIDRTSVNAMAERLGKPLTTNDFRIELHWKLVDQYHVVDEKRQPLFHIKRVWERNYLREVLALHLGINVFDPELFVPNYVTGTYMAGFKKWKSPVPYIMTEFLHGKEVKFSFKRNPLSPLWSWLGRHYYLHMILSLYDVEPRHFLVVDEGTTVKRLDLGLALTKLDQKYDGFQKSFGDDAIKQNTAFQKGVEFEREKVLHNLNTNRLLLNHTLNEFGQLEEDSIVDFNPGQLRLDLINYWGKMVPELDLGNASNSSEF